VLHTLPHAPQLSGSSLRSAHDLLVLPTVHDVIPLAQPEVHLDAEQALPRPTSPLHFVAHFPQLVGSEARFVHIPLHEVRPGGHAGTQLPF